MGRRLRNSENGFTIVELLLSIFVLMIILGTLFDLYTSVQTSSILAQKQAVALTLANNQMEYLYSLPYQNLAVSGGSIPATNTIPATITKTEDSQTYTITTNIVYVDDAYNGCGTYPSLALEEIYCRNYPPPTGAPVDTSPEDYKDVNITVTDSSNLTLATLDTQIAPNTPTTKTNTGTMIVNVVDPSGNPIVGATVNLVNNAVSPTINISGTTDSFGNVVFYGLTPDIHDDYVVSASYPGYSSLTTIPDSGSLVATYPDQNQLVNSASYVSLTLKPMGTYSLLIHTTDVLSNSLANATIYVKGGYKSYTNSSNTQYYYDSMTAPNTSPVSDSNGYIGMTNLVPGDYYFCGDDGVTGCSVNGTTYYLAAAIPYIGNESFYPITVPTYLASSPPSQTFAYNGNDYLQEVQLLLSPDSNFPSIYTLTPSTASISSGNLANFSFSINGDNLPCTATATNCDTKVNFIQGTTTYSTSCTGPATGIGVNKDLNCTANLSGATAGDLQLQIIANGYTFTLPQSLSLGGLVISP